MPLRQLSFCCGGSPKSFETPGASGSGRHADPTWMYVGAFRNSIGQAGSGARDVRAMSIAIDTGGCVGVAGLHAAAAG